MRSGKLLAGLILAAVVLAAAGAGVTFVMMTLNEERLRQDFGLVKSLTDQGDFERARQILDERLDGASPTESWYPEAQSLALELYEQTGDLRAAQGVAQDLIDPEHGFTGEAIIQAHAFLGWQKLEEGSAQRSRPHFEAILAQTGEEGEGVEIAKLGLIRIELAEQGVNPEIRDQLSRLLEDYPASKVSEDIEFVLGLCNVRLLYSLKLLEGDEIYEVKSGDTIAGIARRNKIPQDLLMRVNSITNPRRLSIGKRLKIPDVEFAIQVNKSDNTLTLSDRGRFFKKYRVRTGTEDFLTPVGEYKVQVKKKDPAWSDPKSGKRFPPNDPGNELGTRWIGFHGSSLGIHGTIRPDTIGRYASNGCVGMLKDDVEELFDLVREGTPIRIIGSIRNPTSLQL